MRIVVALLLCIAASVASAQSRIADGSLGVSAYPFNQAGPFKAICLVNYISPTGVIAAGAACYVTAVCTPGSAFNRQTITTSAAVVTFCPAAPPVALSAHGDGLIFDKVHADADLHYPGKYRNAYFKYGVSFSSNDGCNQAGPSNSGRQAKECPTIQ